MDRYAGGGQAPRGAINRRAAVACWTACLALLLAGCASLAPLVTAPMPVTVAGTVRDAAGPIVGASIHLTAYQDERCVALARSATPPAEQDRQALRECVRAGGEAVSDEAGRYTFANVRPGSYDVMISWTLGQGQRVPVDPVFLQGAYAVVIVRNQDDTWVVTARSEIVTIPDEWATIQDFTIQSPGR